MRMTTCNLQDRHIVLATQSHISDIVDIEQQSFASPWSKEAILVELNDLNWSRTFVALNNEQVVGYLSFWTVEKEYQITKIAVTPARRQHGIASQLLSFLISLSKKENIQKITLELRQSNEQAKKLYAKHHFCIVGQRPRYYTDTKEDALLMDLDIESVKSHGQA